MNEEVLEHYTKKEQQRYLIDAAVKNFLNKGGNIRILKPLSNEASEAIISNSVSNSSFIYLDNEERSYTEAEA